MVEHGRGGVLAIGWTRLMMRWPQARPVKMGREK
jgi:hypothetical protein